MPVCVVNYAGTDTDEVLTNANSHYDGTVTAVGATKNLLDIVDVSPGLQAVFNAPAGNGGPLGTVLMIYPTFILSQPSSQLTSEESVIFHNLASTAAINFPAPNPDPPTDS